MCGVQILAHSMEVADGENTLTTVDMDAAWFVVMVVILQTYWITVTNWVFSFPPSPNGFERGNGKQSEHTSVSLFN